MSKTFRTPKGTELPILDLRGKDYMQVAQRIVWFREDHPKASIKTEILTPLEELFTVARAVIYNDDGEVWQTAHKREDSKHFADHMEKAETGAIGRALANCGYGTQFAPELDEEERIVDSPQSRPKTQPKAAQAVSVPSPGPKVIPKDFGDYVVTFGKFAGQALKQLKPDELRSYCRYLLDDSKKKGKPIEGRTKDFLDAAQFFLDGAREQQKSLLENITPDKTDDIPF